MKLSEIKSKMKWGQIVLLFLITASIQQACKEDEETHDSGDKILVSYEKVSTIPAQNVQLGFSLLSTVYPDINNLNFLNPYSVNIYKVKYKTTLNNKTITASGVVCLPDNDGTFPILSFQNGTNTSNMNAPSMNINNDEFLLLENLTGLGYIVTIPDYVGFGESNEILHPYYHRESSDAAVIDLIKACQELLQEQSIASKPNGKLFMIGYSQGGWATLSAYKTLEENNNTGLEPVAASCGAGAYNLVDVTNHILSKNTYGSPVYLSYFIESHQRNGFLNTSLDLYFNQPYSGKIPGLFNGNTHLGSINSALNDTLPRLMTANMLQNFATGSEFEPLRNELAKNSVDAWQAKGKLLFVHGKSDSVVPVFESENMVAKFRQLGIDQNQVQLLLLEGKDHGSGVTPWAIQTMIWLNGMK
jgi:dienelactone hydrolase